MNQIEEMRNFVRVVESGSLTQAAEQYGMAKSAVSKRLSDLEHRLGVSLLTRTTRTQKLTETGQSYYQSCLRILDDIEDLESTIKNEQCELKGKIRLAAPLSFGLNHLVPALNAFNEIHPEIFFDIDFNDRKVDLIEEGFDLAFRIADLQDSNLMASKITDIRVYLLASPAYLSTHAPINEPNDLLNGHVKLHYSSAPHAFEFQYQGKTKKIKIPAVLTSNNGDHLCDQAIKGKGIVGSPDFICYKQVKAGLLVPLLKDYTQYRTIGAYALYPHQRRLSRRVRSLIDFLKTFYGEKPYWCIES